jgi:hypothetical protein
VLEGDHAQDTVSKVHKTVSTAHPILDGVSGTLLPPVGRGVAVHVRPIAYQVATDAAVTADDASGAVPHAQELGTGAHRNATELTSHAVTDVTLVVTSSTRRDLTTESR